jgi:hypothetical protein
VVAAGRGDEGAAAALHQVLRLNRSARAEMPALPQRHD